MKLHSHSYIVIRRCCNASVLLTGSLAQKSLFEFYFVEISLCSIQWKGLKEEIVLGLMSIVILMVCYIWTPIDMLPKHAGNTLVALFIYFLVFLKAFANNGMAFERH